MAGKSNGDAAKLIAQAEALISKMPITEAKASEKDFASIFKKKRKKATTKITGRQAEVEGGWDNMVKANYAKAVELANKAKIHAVDIGFLNGMRGMERRDFEILHVPKMRGLAMLRNHRT